MTKTFEQGKDEIAEKVEYFRTNRDAIHDPRVKEADVRQSLIDPLFEALGWDVRNTAAVAPQYREVVPEASLEEEGQQKAPDYAFRVGTLPKFYAEAKKCSVNIDADPGPALQLRRYGWSAKVALSVLTNFEELGVYDCTLRPRQTDKASYARTHHFHFDQYADRWRELWDVFSREAVWSGGFDQYAASKRKRGTSEVDVEFLKEIEGWRDALAHNIALRNKDLPSEDLNTAVQLTIDRVVFLRMAEDRKLEPEQQLLKLCEQPDIYARFMRELCRRADQKYNSGLFHFQKEAGVSEAPDQVTPNLAVDDKVFKPILQSLYFAHGSPYHFGVLPVEILGTVYERFLGKVIRLTAGHQAKVEEKPEVRKAGGVYYTPAYIVDYIVKHTVGREIEGRSPMQLAGLRNGKEPLRVLDMACGSGSFLLGAYQCLLDHCLKWYSEHKPETRKKAVYREPRNGHWRLTIEEKKRILTTHIFGVDIDPQAVEVSKLSLLLKVLEGETEQSLQRGLLPFSDRALPNLADNIKCGNSLIGPDYFTGKVITDGDEVKRINPLDWTRAFPEAIDAGGFDCIIGNPPYGRDVLSEFREHFETQFEAMQYKVDSFVLFLERAAKLLTESGAIGYIIPNTWLNTERFYNLRRFLLNRCAVQEIVNLGKGVFLDANIDTLLIFLGRGRKGTVRVLDASNRAFGQPRLEQPVRSVKVRQAEWMSMPNCEFDIFFDPAWKAVLGKIAACSAPLGDLTEISQGLIPYNTKEMSAKNPYLSARKKGRLWRPLLDKGACVGRYSLKWNGVYVKFGPWLYTPNKPKFYDNPKVLVQRHRNPSLRRRVVATFDDEGHCFKDNLCGMIGRDAQYSLKYILGIVNSRLTNEFYRRAFTEVSLNPTYLRRLPIRAIDFSSKADLLKHSHMVALVDNMLALHRSLASTKSEGQTTAIQRQIDATDAEIDRLVYELYGLTAKEVALVEGAKA